MTFVNLLSPIAKLLLSLIRKSYLKEVIMKINTDIGRRKFIKNSAVSVLGGGIYLNSLNRSPVIKKFSGEDNSKKKNGIDKIEYRKLGNIDYKASLLGFGAMITTNSAVLEEALNMGVNYIDTARGYQNGNNEVMVGKVIKKKRKNVFLTTKESAKSKKSILEGTEESLKALDTDYIDALLAHGLSSREQVYDEDIMSALEKLKKEGKARFVGVSIHTNVAEVVNAIVDSKFYDLVTVRYNFRSDEKLKKTVKKANNAGIAVVAMKVMAGGKGYVGSEMKGLNPCQTALKWVMSDKNVATTIPSITSFQQLEENFNTMGAKMSWSERKTLYKYAKVMDREFCAMCDECSGICPQNVNIIDIMRYLMYADGYGELELGRDSYRSLSYNEPASKCIDCDDCLVPCVNNLNIKERMLHAHSILA